MSFARIHILVVDDLIDSADTTVELLSIWGYDALACYSGEAALRSARSRRPAAVILDLAMPGMDGFEFAVLFRETPGCRASPMIALSGYCSQPFRRKALDSGIGHYLLKPADPTSLKTLLVQALVADPSPTALCEDADRLPAVDSIRNKKRILCRMAAQAFSAPLTKGCPERDKN